MDPSSIVTVVWSLCSIVKAICDVAGVESVLPDGDCKKKKNCCCCCCCGERKTTKDAIDETKEKPEHKESNKLVQPQLATAMLKVHWDCDCVKCTHKIQKVVTKRIGDHLLSIDGSNGQMTLKGSMDMNALAKSLGRKLKCYVEIVPLSPQKKDEKEEKSGCDHKEMGGGERKVKPSELQPTVDQKKSKNNNKGDEGENKVNQQRIAVPQTDIRKAKHGIPGGESVLHDGDGKNKKNGEKKNDDGGCGGGEQKTKKDVKDKPKEKLGQKKSNELVQPQLATAMLKVHLHCVCDGHTKKIQKVVTKTIGYHQMAINRAKCQLTAKGSIKDMKDLAKALERKLKKSVEIVPLSPQKEGEKKEKSGYDHKEKDGGFKEKESKKKEGEKKNMDEQNKSKK